MDKLSRQEPMTVRRGLSRDRLALIAAYTGRPCVYCGGRKWVGRLACWKHADLPTVDPHFAQR